MKKGKTSHLTGFKNAKVLYGTVDSVNFKSLYLNIQTWVEPIIYSENWQRIVLNLSRSIRHTIYEVLDRSLFDENFIVDLDLRSSGLTLKKRSFMNLEINLYLKDSSSDFKSKELNNSLKLIAKKVISQNLSKNENFKCYLTKSGKQKVLVTQS
jgi:hypothetical protein